MNTKPVMVIKSLDDTFQMGTFAAVTNVRPGVSFELIHPLLGTRTFNYKLIDQVQEIDLNINERGEEDDAHRRYECGIPLF